MSARAEHAAGERIADVWLPLKLAHPFSYRISPEQSVNAGDFVRVRFRGKEEVGVVWAVRAERPEEKGRKKKRKLLPIEEVCDFPAMSEARRRFIEWMAAYYVVSPGLVLRLFLASREGLSPPAPKLGWKAAFSEEEAKEKGLKLTPQRARVLARAAQGRALSAAELARLTGVSPSVVRGLIDGGWLVSQSIMPDASAGEEEAPPLVPALSTDQARAAEELRKLAQDGRFAVALLDGVTGAGKTEVYFEAMAEALKAGRQVLLLLPEIALTAGFIRRVAERFGIRPAEWHSELSKGQRARIFRGVAEGRVRIVVAARSGLFLPWRNLGLIVVDEEHESAYKQETAVPYHGRDVAVMMGKMHGFPVILSSATPSLESLVNAERGRYRHIILRERYGSAILPDIALIDLRRHKPEPGSWLSAPLIEAIGETLEKGEQALLFLNRRGYAPLTLCRACGHRLQCPHCSAWLVWHRAPPAELRHMGGGDVLLCHHCGHALPVPDSCPECGAEERMAAVGPGVERLAEEAAQRWPEARIATLSSDLWQGQALKQLMSQIAEGAYDIIIGTQLIAKGHHFPKLTLAGIVDADLALESVDPRAAERTWQQLAQVAGRAGREHTHGRALIQTWMPDTPLMQALKAGDRDAFIAQEKRMRELAQMPPFGRLAAVIVSGPEGEVGRFCQSLAARAPASRIITVLGPAPAPLERLRGRQRWRFLLKGPREADLQGYLRAWLGAIRLSAGIRADIDIDPYSFL